jgi:hypothetical protein
MGAIRNPAACGILQGDCRSMFWGLGFSEFRIERVPGK